MSVFVRCEWHMNLCSQLSWASQPYYYSKYFNQRAMLVGTIDFNVYTTFSDIYWRSEDQWKADWLGFIFKCTCQLIRVKFDMMSKQLKIVILILLLNESCTCWIKGNKCCFTDCQKLHCFDISVTLTLKVAGMGESRTSAPVFSQSSQWIG